MIEFRTLGTLELTDADGREIHSVLAQPKPLALLTLLVLHSPDGYHRRDTLLGLLWPELDEQRARHALSQALHVLRQGLGESVLLKRGQEELRIDRALLWCDASAFQEATKRQDHEAALELYRGDLLEGFFVSEASGFERWLGNERIRLQELAAGAAWRLARRRIEEGGLVEAERTAQRALSLVATDESEVRDFVEALAKAGDRAAAIRFYEKFAERLRDEYEVEPAPETVQLIEVVRNRGAAVREDSVAVLNVKQASAPRTGATPAVRGSDQRVLVASGHSKAAVRWLAAVALVIVVVVAVALGSSSREAGTVFVPNRVVVSLFENQTGDSILAPLALMAADWLSDGLARTGMVEVITPTGVRDAFKAAATQGTPWSGQDGTVALAEMMHAGIVVSGQLYLVSDEVMIRAEAVRMPGLVALGGIDPLTVATANPGPALDTLRQRVMGLLAIHLHPRLADWARTVERPPTYEAYREFVAGLGLMSAPGTQLGLPTPEEQLQHLLRAAALDTMFVAPLIRAVGIGAFREYRIWQAFRDSVLEVIEQRQHLLTPVERYEVEALRARPVDWFGAYQAMRRAADLAPDRLTDLASAALNAGRYSEAVEILERPDLPLGLDGYPWGVLGVSLHFLGDYERELEVARRARSENPGHRGFMAREITALAALGRFEEIEATMQESRLTGRTVAGAAPMGWVDAGFELFGHGYERQGLEVYERVVDYIRDQPEESQDKAAIAGAFLFLGRFEEAQAIYEELARRERENIWYHELLLEGIALAAIGCGDTATALQISTDLKAAEGPQPIVAWNFMHRASISARLGDCAAAVELLDEALRLGVSHTMIHMNYGLMNCRDYPPFQEVAKPRE